MLCRRQSVSVSLLFVANSLGFVPTMMTASLMLDVSQQISAVVATVILALFNRTRRQCQPRNSHT